MTDQELTQLAQAAGVDPQKLIMAARKMQPYAGGGPTSGPAAQPQSLMSQLAEAMKGKETKGAQTLGGLFADWVQPDLAGLPESQRPDTLMGLFSRGLDKEKWDAAHAADKTNPFAPMTLEAQLAAKKKPPTVGGSLFNFFSGT